MEPNQTIDIVRVTSQSPAPYFADLARLHQAEITKGFLSSLGPEVLQTLYRELADSPQACLLAAITQESVVGLICGAMDTSAIYRRLIVRQSWRLIPRLIPLVFSPARIVRVAETLLYPARGTNVDLPRPEILNFCVDQKQQRKGIGQRLFARLVEEFKSHGVARIRIVTGGSQTTAQRFYESIGAVKVQDISIHRGVQSHVYVYDLPNDSRQPPWLPHPVGKVA